MTMIRSVRRTATSIIVLAIFVAGTAEAQGRPALGPQASRLFTLPDTAPRPPARDYHVEGGLVGAGTVGILGALIGSDVCSTSDTHHGSCVGNALGVGLVGAVVGWVTGSLIGGLIPKGS
ncbi:MAG TPA: hypothetical protein VFI39_08985 [Gemmatimonadales bacterium]|nr:hypothetical protein [Gemmatimonadales bacterium]